MLLEKISSYIRNNNLISEGEHVAVALSGGRDSVCLLHILYQLQSHFSFSLSAIHINHNIRGKDSDGDQQFTEKLCQSLGLKYSAFDLQGFDENSSEDALRKKRYQLFDDFISKNNNSKIATGHHLNDQLETYLMRLFKGSGPKGLLGIPLVRGPYIRPLLEVSRKEIDTFCEENTIHYREDYTNAVDDKLRNMIRISLLPPIEKIFGAEYIQQFFKSHSDYQSLYAENLEKNHDIFKRIIKKINNQTKININDFESLSELQKSQFLEYCFSYLYGLDCSISREQISAFESFLQKAQTGTKFLFIDSIETLKDRDKIIFYPANKKSEKNKKLYLNQSIQLENCSIVLREVSTDYQLSDNPLIEIICGDRIKLPLTIRFWQEGDFFYPLGSKNRQKLSDFFTNNKVARINKKKIPIISNGNEIVWLAGLRMDERYKVTGKCHSYLRLEMTYE